MPCWAGTQAAPQLTVAAAYMTWVTVAVVLHRGTAGGGRGASVTVLLSHGTSKPIMMAVRRRLARRAEA